MSNVIPFDFDQRQVRVVRDVDGEMFFVVRDIAVALEYSESSLASLSRLVGHVPEEWKGRNRILTPGGYQDLLTLTEQGLYFFVARSDKPKALPFQKWLAGEVLPAIRKTGMYQVEAPTPADDRLPVIARASALAGALDAAARAFGFDENMRLLSVNQAVQKRTGVNLLGELGATHLLSPINERYLTPTELGLPLDMSAIAVNRALRDLGYQRQQADGRGKNCWVLTEAGRKAGGRMLDTGKRHGDGAPVQQLKWPESVSEALKEAAA